VPVTEGPAFQHSRTQSPSACSACYCSFTIERDRPRGSNRIHLSLLPSFIRTIPSSQSV